MENSRALVCRGRPDADGITRKLVCSVKEADNTASYETRPEIAVNNHLRIQRPLTHPPPIEIRQSHFATGTLRIRNPGRYVFAENVEFNAPVGPESTRADTPLNGFWFAGISVEVDGVDIDGDGHQFLINRDYVLKNKIGTFAVILLGNNQFSGALFGGGGTQYPDTDAYVAANNVTVSNLKIVGNGSHFGIMANNNTNFAIHNNCIRDCQVSNIYIQSGQTVKVTNNDLYGSTSPVTITQEITQLELLRQNLSNFISQGIPGASIRLAALENFALINPGRFRPSSQKFPSVSFGLFITPGPTAVSPFPVTPEGAAVISSLVDGFRNGEYSSDVVVDNNSLFDFTNLFTELVAIGTNIPENPLLPLSSWPLVVFGLFGTIQWRDAFDGNGNFAPNDFLKALVFVMNVVWPFLGQAQEIFPANSLAIFDAILNNKAAQFYQNAAPIVSRQSDGSTAKGLFAVRAIAVNGGIFKNIKVINMKSLGPPPIIPSTLPGYANLTAPQDLFRSHGNDIWAMSLESSRNITIGKMKMRKYFNKNGYIFGVDLAESNSDILVHSSSLKDAFARNELTTPTMEPSDIFGFVTGEDNDGHIGNVIFRDLKTKNLVAGGEVTPFSPPRNTPPLLIHINLCAL